MKLEAMPIARARFSFRVDLTLSQISGNRPNTAARDAEPMIIVSSMTLLRVISLSKLGGYGSTEPIAI